MRETQDLVTIIPWTFIAQICNLFIQCWLIKKFLFKPVCAIIEKRRALADSDPGCEKGKGRSGCHEG